MGVLTFFVPGIPTTQGSTRAFVAGGRARITTDNESLKPWRDSMAAIAFEARREIGWVPADEAISTEWHFWLPRPKSAPKTRDVLPITAADLDKLVRAANDAMTNAGVWIDDSRVCHSEEFKRYVVTPALPKIYDPAIHLFDRPGLFVRLWHMENHDD